MQQCECTDNIGFDELGRTVDRTIDMALGGKIHDRIGLVLLEQLAERLCFADALTLECIAGVFSNACQRFKIGSVGQFVDIDDAGLGVAQKMANYR